MGQNVLERMASNHSAERVRDFLAMQAMPYAFKRAHAEERAWAFYEDPAIAGQAYVAVGVRVERSADGSLQWKYESGIEGDPCWLPGNMFPSIRPGMAVELVEIINQA